MSEASSTEDVITLRIRFRSETFEKFTERYAADLTQNEIFIRTREPLPVGSSLALDFSLNDGSPLISGRGSVAWTRGPELTQQAPSGMGIRFESLTGPSRQMLANILEAKARLANNQPIAPPAPAAPPERPEPPRMPRPATATLTTRPPPERSAGRSDAGRAAPASSSSGRYPAVTLPPSQPPPTAALAPPAPTVPLAPIPPPAASTRPMRSAFLEDDAEPTELANLPPAFFYESADEEDPEKTRLQDPKASAALLRQQMADTEDDLTNPRARASTYSGGGLGTGTRPLAKSMLKAPAKAPPRAPAPRAPSPEPEQLEPDPSPPPASPPIIPTLSSDWAARMPRTGRPERRTPPESPVSYGGQSPAATREIKAPVLPSLADSQTDNNPLILSSSTTEALPPDHWRPSPASMATAPIQMPPEREAFYGQPSVSPPPPPPPRWGSGNMETMETMNTSPSLPAVLGQDPNNLSAPAWPVPTDNPDVQLPPAQPSDDEARKSRNASVRMWVTLTLAAAGIVAAALLLLPALLKPSPQVGEATPPPPAEAPATEDKAAAANPSVAPPASPPPAGEAAGSPPTAAASPPTPPAAAGTAAARTEEAATTRPESAAPQDPSTGAEGAQAGRQPGGPAGRPVRPGGPLPGRNPRRTAREVIAAADARERAAAAAAPAAAAPAIAPPPAVTEVAEPKAPVASPPGIQGDGAEEVYWLTVRSIPSGADVLIDGQVEGQTPFVRRIFDPSRSYALTVRRAGFDPHERTLSTSDVWTKRGNVRTLTVVAKLSAAAGLPNQAEPPPVSPTRGVEPTQPATSNPPATAPPPIEPDRKTNPFADPASPGGAQPQ